jgi:hypothetical protein
MPLKCSWFLKKFKDEVIGIRIKIGKLRPQSCTKNGEGRPTHRLSNVRTHADWGGMVLGLSGKVILCSVHLMPSGLPIM